MERKKWTPQVEVTDSHLKFREKRKWQLALRRYVLEKNVSSNYAIYFGLSIDQFRKWIQIQFSEDFNWENFGKAWQFEHIVPVAYFDFSCEEDLYLCWNFINIRVESIDQNKKGTNHIDVMAVKPYFKNIYDKTGYSVCLRMIAKINKIEALNIVSNPAIEDFIINNKEQLEKIAVLNKDEFNNLNLGMSLNDIYLEREIIKKFG